MPITGSMGMFLLADEVPTTDESVDLVVNGASTSGVYAGIDFVTYADESGNFRESYLPIFLQVVDSERSIRNMNLWTDGCRHEISRGVPLHLENLQSGVLTYMDMFVSGEGITPDAMGLNSSLNLFLRRNMADAVTLYINGPGIETTGVLPLLIEGSAFVDVGVDMSLPEILGYETDSVQLYTHGF